MEINEYQEKTLETVVFDDKNPISYCILGLNGEAGEIANKYKKVLRGDTELTEELKAKIKDEIGDVQWYLSVLSNLLGFTLEDVCKTNIKKLNERRENGTIKGDGDKR
jgi:NTP pyrophosphatase (non-canonical NTP hydrolase)